MHGVTSYEYLFSCLMMCLGAFFLSITIGSLSSLLNNLDAKNALLQEKQEILNNIRKQHEIDQHLFNRINKALKFGVMKSDNENIGFLNTLPINLRTELSILMHKDLVSGIDFFKHKPARFVGFIGPLLKPMKISRDEFVFTEGE